MKKYLVLYRSTISSKEQMSKMSPEQAKAGMDVLADAGEVITLSAYDHEAR